MGVMVTFILLLALAQGSGYGPYISIAILITGLVCTARLIVSDHQSREIYMGLGVGILCQYIAFHADFLTS